MLIRAATLTGVIRHGAFRLRCPACRHLGVFEELGTDVYVNHGSQYYGLGQRRCPNPTCQTHLFVVYQENQIVLSYPAERIDFDSTNIPAPIVAALEEAITCHANQCYKAAAMMVRKTLETLCLARNATGGDLAKRIRALGSQAILPTDLFDGLDELRFLGNDAAHVESVHFDEVGEIEVSVAIEFTKEVLKAVYQYAALLERLRALRSQPAST